MGVCQDRICESAHWCYVLLVIEPWMYGVLWASRSWDAGLNRHIFLVGASPTLPFNYGRWAAILGRLFWSIVASVMSQSLGRALRRAGIQLRVKAFLMCRLGLWMFMPSTVEGLFFLPLGFYFSS